ncbi:glycosyl hydrolase [Sphingobium sp.]|uniref:glycosyl hydrolase n=1 Tax=Sphingobium sp. TaxID=1912891 RepID=UPI0039C8F1BC
MRSRVRLGPTLALIGLATTALTGWSNAAFGKESGPSLEAFRDPPSAARPRVWWHWLNGNITKDGIDKDLAWMKRIGIGGVQTFDINFLTPNVVPHRLMYMTPEWKDAFHFAAQKADKLGLELTIASSPGWSETGGPWVKTADGMKKLVWSETTIRGGQSGLIQLAAPPTISGPFQELPLKPEPGLAGRRSDDEGGGVPCRPGGTAPRARIASAHLDRWRQRQGRRAGRPLG